MREATSLDFTEARILVDRILEEYLDSGGRAELDRLSENREHLPWYLPEAETPREHSSSRRSLPTTHADPRCREKAAQSPRTPHETAGGWGAVSFDPNDREIPVRVLIEREAADTRILVARLVREYQESGRRAELALLLDRRNDVRGTW